MAKKATKAVKGRKKKWVAVLAPKVFNEQPIGEMHLYETNEGIGRKVSVSLMTLTNDFKKQGIYLTFLITGMRGENLTTELTAFKFSTSTIKKMTRRRRALVNDSFLAVTADGKTVRIKPFVITRSKTSNSVLTKIRHAIRGYTIRTLRKTRYDNFVQDLVARRFQRNIYSAARKVHPVSTCEVRWMKIEEKKEKGEGAEAPVQEERKEERKEVNAKPEKKPAAPEKIEAKPEAKT